MERRHFLGTALRGPAALAAGAWATARPARTLAATPECPDPGDPTPRQTEGPFYKPRSPERASLLEPGIEGRRIVLGGRVLTTRCRPVARALIDVWQADALGRYDNAGFRLRGHFFTGADGRWRLETVVPGAYPGRTAHIHVKVQPPGGRVLTTQLYFPGVPANERDGLFDPALLVAMNGASGRFDFVLDAAAG